MDALDQTEYTKTEFPFASFTQRLSAFLIDWILIILAEGFISILFGNHFFDQIIHVRWFGNILTLIYFIYMEGSQSQATFGKQLMHLKVVNQVGERISYVQSIIRSLSKIISACILLIGFIMIIFDGKKRGLHDIFATTFVIKSN